MSQKFSRELQELAQQVKAQREQHDAAEASDLDALARRTESAIQEWRKRILPAIKAAVAQVNEVMGKEEISLGLVEGSAGGAYTGGRIGPGVQAVRPQVTVSAPGPTVHRPGTMGKQLEISVSDQGYIAVRPNLSSIEPSTTAASEFAESKIEDVVMAFVKEITDEIANPFSFQIRQH